MHRLLCDPPRPSAVLFAPCDTLAYVQRVFSEDRGYPGADITFTQLQQCYTYLAQTDWNHFADNFVHSAKILLFPAKNNVTVKNILDATHFSCRAALAYAALTDHSRLRRHALYPHARYWSGCLPRQREPGSTLEHLIVRWTEDPVYTAMLLQLWVDTDQPLSAVPTGVYINPIYQQLITYQPRSQSGLVLPDTYRC